MYIVSITCISSNLTKLLHSEHVVTKLASRLVFLNCSHLMDLESFKQ